jgi:uncharacterized alkaline shock family protein YloU
MPDNEVRSPEDTGHRDDLGKIEISPEVIEIIAGLAALEVSGVAAMHGNFASGMVDKLSGRKYGRGVKVDLTDNGIVIDVHLTVNFGTSIPDVAENVQVNIIRALKKMTALEVEKINIHVVGIQFDSPARKTIGED